MAEITDDEIATSMRRVIDGFAVYVVLDDRGRLGDLVGYFNDRAIAEMDAKGKGWFGGQGEIIPVPLLMIPSADGAQYYALREPKPVRINVNLIEDTKRVLREAREQAEKTLTPKQRKLLGLDF